jgi:hypothetical protein
MSLDTKIRIKTNPAWAVFVLVGFVVTIDGSVSSFGSKGTAIITTRANGILALENGMEREPAISSMPQNEPTAPPASFLLFDYKQNLRLWPVLAGDISRSPPVFGAR